MLYINRIWIAIVAYLVLMISSASYAQPVVPGHVVEVYAELDAPQELSFDPAGVLYAGNGGEPDHIYRITAGGAMVEEYGDTPLEDPDPVLFDDVGLISGTPGSVLVGNEGAGELGYIAAIAPDETTTVIFGPTPVFVNPASMEFDSSGRMVFTDWRGDGVLVSDGRFPTVLFEQEGVYSLAIGDQDRIYTGGINAAWIEIHDAAGNLIDPTFANVALGDGNMTFAPPGSAWGDDLYAVASDTSRLLRINALGEVTVLGQGFNRPKSIAFGPDDAMYVSSYNNDEIYRILPECLGDIDGNGVVDTPDLLILLAQWGPCPPTCLGDIDGDGGVGVSDLILLLGNWGPCPK